MLECLNDIPTEKLAELRAKTNRQLAAYVRAKLNLAVQLACKAERERRAGRWNSAEQCQRQWEGLTAEVRRLLPLVRFSGVCSGETETALALPKRVVRLSNR